MGWWIWVIRSISASIRNEFARVNCYINGIESFRSYNGGLQNSRAFPDIRFICTSKNVNSDLNSKEIPRLCRGDRNSLTFPGVHLGHSGREPPSTRRRGESRWTKPKVSVTPSGSVNSMWFLFQNAGVGPCPGNCGAISERFPTRWLDNWSVAIFRAT